MHLSTSDIEKILACYGIPLLALDEERDSSRGEDDLRYHYFINGQYVLHCAWGMPMDEERLQEIAALIRHYHSIQVYCPPMIQATNGRYSVKYSTGGKEFICYLDEKAPYPNAEEEGEWEQIHPECCRVLGKLAALYTGKNLSSCNSMWALIDLPPWGGEMDEKQENALQLAEDIEKAGNPALSRHLLAFDRLVRNRIQKDYKRLPRCAFQGDLNASNILVEDGRMKGLLDFNLSGTEVNINCFLNETDSFPEEADILSKNAATLWNDAIAAQQRKLDEVFRFYSLNDLEKDLLPWYRVNVFLFQWPNVCLMEKLLKNDQTKEAIYRLIEYIITLHEENI